MAWDDAPPTPEELSAAAPVPSAAAPSWDSQPPSPAELAALHAAPASLPTGNEPSTLEALLRGGLQGATMGFSDEIIGGGEALIDKVLGSDKSLGDLYAENRDESRKANAAADQAHPFAYGGGNLAGGFATGAFTGGLGAASAAGRIAAGAGLGAVGGVGYGNADNVNDAAKEALKGAALGGAVSGVFEGVRKVLNPTTIQNFAANRAAKALGADKTTVKKLGQEEVRALGRKALDEGVVTPFAGTETMVGRVDDMLAKHGPDIGGTYNIIDKAGLSTLTVDDLAQQVDDQLGKFYRDPINKDIAAAFDNILETIHARGGMPGQPIPLSVAQDLKETIKRRAYPAGWKYKPYTTKDQQELEMFQQAYGIVNKAIDDVVDQAGSKMQDPQLLETFKRAKEQYGAAKGMQTLLKNRGAGEAGNNFFGLGEKMAAGAAFLKHGTLEGTAAVGAHKLVNMYGNQSAAVAADKLADVIRSAPHLLGPWGPQLQAAAARGGASLAVTNHVLMQTNPEYREKMREVFDEGGKK